MLIPIVCFSCGQCIAHLYKHYIDRVNYYKKNTDELITKRDEIFTRHQLNETNAAIVSEYIQNITPEEAALDDLNIKRMCCRRMFLTQCDTYNLVNIQ